MSALGKPVLDGDFDESGQIVVQTPAGRVIERSVVVTRTISEKPRSEGAVRSESVRTSDQIKSAPKAQAAQDQARHNVQPPLPYPLAPHPKASDLKLDRSRDGLLTAFGKATLTDRYLMPGESFQDMFARVSCAYADDVDHAQRLYDDMSRLWFMPATPILSNGGTKRGLPISCFLNDVSDSLRRHCRHLERECLAGVQWRRHRHLLGQGPLHRREGEDRPDQRHHSLHPCDGRR